MGKPWSVQEPLGNTKRDASGEIVYTAPIRRWPKCGSCGSNATWVAVGPYFFRDHQLQLESSAEDSWPRAAFGCENGRRCGAQIEITDWWYWFQLTGDLTPNIQQAEFREHIERKTWGPYFLLWLETCYDMEAKPTRKPIGAKLRFQILERDAFTCHYCNRTKDAGAVLHIDHLIPVSKGGTNDPDNLVAACQDCNLGKGDK